MLLSSLTFISPPPQKVADNIHDIDEFGDLPEELLHRLSQILSKRRALTPRTLDLFLRRDLRGLDIYDCASKSLLTLQMIGKKKKKKLVKPDYSHLASLVWDFRLTESCRA